MKENILKWIQNWYQSQCNEDWEHQYGIKIESLDNPGWQIMIDLSDTDVEDLDIPYKLFENSENDWYGISISKKKFEACGDPQKLEFLLNKFREIIESHSSKS